MKRLIEAIVELASRRAWLVVIASVAFVLLAGSYARDIEVRSDLAELLPRDSPGFLAYEHQAGRAGGSSMLILIASSPSRQANERFVDELASRVTELQTRQPRLVAGIESNTRDIRHYYEANRWLYADLEELERIDDDLDRQIAIRSGLVEDLLAEEVDAAAPGPKEALGLTPAVRSWKERVTEKDTFPTGYFSARDGTLVGLRIASNAGLGGPIGDALLDEVKSLADVLRHEPGLEGVTVGFTGDIASAVGEKKALLSEAAYATAIAVAIILLAIVLYFRSFASLLVIGLPVAIGVTAAYAFARFAFGYVNAAGAFLGAIIVGNGINYPVVLYARYREFRTRGMAPEIARREAVLNALRAELVGACVAAVAYGSLALTQFRDFQQFGLIGFVGMLLVWASIVPVVPALTVLVERLGGDRPPRAEAMPTRLLARAVTARPWLFVGAGAVLAVLATAQIPKWICDPWEYDFGKLGSRSSDVSGAGEWSNKANEVFGGKMNIAGASMIADTPAQVPLLKARILANDAADPQGRMLADVTTIDDALPGSADLQRRKLAVLDRIPARSTASGIRRAARSANAIRPSSIGRS